MGGLSCRSALPKLADAGSRLPLPVLTYRYPAAGPSAFCREWLNPNPRGKSSAWARPPELSMQGALPDSQNPEFDSTLPPRKMPAHAHGVLDGSLGSRCGRAAWDQRRAHRLAGMWLHCMQTASPGTGRSHSVIQTQRKPALFLARFSTIQASAGALCCKTFVDLAQKNSTNCRTKSHL